MLRRRWGSFSLKTVLVAGVLAAVFMRCFVLPAIRQKSARDWLDSHRATYSYDASIQSDEDWYDRPGGLPIPKLAIDRLGIDLFASVRVVLLDCDEIYDLEPMGGLRDLEELYINQFIHPSGQISSSHCVGIVVDRSVDPTPYTRRIAEQSTTLQIAQF